MALPGGGKVDVWPCYASSFIRRPHLADVGDAAVPDREALLGMFGLIPHWAKETTIGRRTFNARTLNGGLVSVPVTEQQHCALSKAPATSQELIHKIKHQKFALHTAS